MNTLPIAKNRDANRAWFLLEEYKDFPPLFLYDFVTIRSKFFHKFTGLYLDSALLYDSGRALTCFDRTTFFQNKRALLKKVLRDPSFLEKIYRRTDQLIKRWSKLTALIKSSKGKLKTLASPVKKLQACIDDLTMIGQLINVLEFDDAWFTKELKKYLERNLPKSKPAEVEQKFLDLTNPFRKPNAMLIHALDKKYQRLFSIARNSIASKNKRYQTLLRHNILLRQLTRRIATNHDINIHTILSTNTEGLLTTLRSPKKTIPSMNPNRSGIITIGKNVYRLHDNQHRAIRNKIQGTPIKITASLKGQCAMPGYVTGQVVVVDSVSDLNKMKHGSILVSHTTTADLMSAVKQAAAIVTEMGGITCHAAIVSRELNIPCVIGTKIATRVLKDGDMVEVDAERGIVRKLSLPARSPAPNGARAEKGIVKLLKKA